jgi:hypothetical protein
VSSEDRHNTTSVIDIDPTRAGPRPASAQSKLQPDFTYTANAGQMTLVAELCDSETGQILMRAVDNQRARSNGTFQWTTSVTNMGAARQIITGWASTLRRQLDAANGR